MRKETKTWQEAVKVWKSGHPIGSASLGGIGPGYEQAIQALLFEIMDRWGNKPLPLPLRGKLPKEYTDHVGSIVHEMDKAWGFSGAQVGQAQMTAWRFMNFGYAEMMNKLPEDRYILVSNRLTPAEEKKDSE